MFSLKFSVFLYCAIILAVLLPQSSAFNSSNLHLSPVVNYIINFPAFNMFQLFYDMRNYFFFKNSDWLLHRWYEKRNEAYFPKDWEMFQI